MEHGELLPDISLLTKILRKQNQKSRSKRKRRKLFDLVFKSISVIFCCKTSFSKKKIRYKIAFFANTKPTEIAMIFNDRVKVDAEYFDKNQHLAVSKSLFGLI